MGIAQIELRFELFTTDFIHFGALATTDNFVLNANKSSIEPVLLCA